MNKSIKSETIVTENSTLEKKMYQLNRSVGMLVYEVICGNPNGDPDVGNAPRTFPDGYGWVSPMSIKRKIRDFLSDHDNPVFKDFVKRDNLDPERLYVFESRNKGYAGTSELECARKAMALAKSDPEAFLNRYFDVRIFGTTALPDGLEKEKKEEPRFVRTGCVSIGVGCSIAPVEIIEASVTKKSPLSADHLATDTGRTIKDKDPSGDIGPNALKFIRHGMYYQLISVNPHCAHLTNAAQEDIDILKKILPHIFETSSSCARPSGSMNLQHVWWADHSNTIGSFKETEFINNLKPTAKNDKPICLSDYNVPNAAECGFSFEVHDLS